MKKITTVLFDLDGTLLPMDQDTFIHAYFGGLARKLIPHGYEKDSLFAAIWAGTRAMVKNNGEKKNEDAFWDVFSSTYGQEFKHNIELFDDFYANDFCHVQKSCGYTKKAAEVITLLKKKGYRIALATNPLFPATATEQRIGWAGLSPNDFELYTTYENSNYCKPNLDYYRAVMNKLSVTPEECLMVGNDVGEDMIATELGASVFLLTDCLINKENVDISVYPNGNFDALLNYINENL